MLNTRKHVAPCSAAYWSVPSTDDVSPPSVIATNVSPSPTFSAAAWRRPPSAKSSKNSTLLMSAKSPPVMMEADRSASARSAGVSSAARR